MDNYKKKALYVTGGIVFVLFFWALFAVHNSAVDISRTKRNETASASGNGCPFSASSTGVKSESKAVETKPKSCCHSSKGKPVDMDTPSVEQIKKHLPESADLDELIAKYSGRELTEQDLAEIKKMFTPEQLAKCPHLSGKSKN